MDAGFKRIYQHINIVGQIGWAYLY